MANIYDKSSLVLIPSGTKTSKVYSQKPVNGDGDFTFTRSSAATRVNADGNIEKETQNKLLRSNKFDTTWGTTNSSVTGGQSGYDGSSDAWLLNVTGGTCCQQIAQNVSVSGVNTFSAYVKKGTKEGCLIYASGNGNPYADFNLATGNLINIKNGAIDAKIQSVGNDWYRCSISFTGSINQVRIYVADASGDISQTSGNIYIQDAQLEQGLVARDYIETTTAAVEGGITDNVPRLDYTDSSCPALLLEPQRTNLVTQSEYFGGWSVNSNITRTSNYIVSPDGTQNATRLQFTANGFCANISQSLATYTISCYAKRNDSGTQNVGFFTNGSGVVNSAWAVTSEWKRFSYTFPALNGGTMGIAGLSGADISVYGFQIEGLASYATSYIPTYGSSVTRTGELCNNAGSASTFNDSEGVLYAEFNTLSINPASSRYITISNGSASNRIAIRQPSGADNKVSLFVVVGGSVQVNLTHTLNILNFNKIAIKYKVNDFALWVNGVEVLTDTSGSVPATGTLNKLDFANFNGSSLPFEGNAKQILYFPTALTDSELATLTTL